MSCCFIHKYQHKLHIKTANNPTKRLDTRGDISAQKWISLRSVSQRALCCHGRRVQCVFQTLQLHQWPLDGAYPGNVHSVALSIITR